MLGLTSPLWPIHYKPLPDELLSCWLVRLAHGHGMKSQTFCNVIFGNRIQIWNRDIDRLAPSWLLDELSRRTGTSPETVLNTTLRTYEGLLYRQFRLSGALHWILVLKMYHRKREGHGLQFCPTCLAEDTIPYFRKNWRIAFNTVCTRHGTMLLDRCPKCSVAVAVHRLDMARPADVELAPLSYCHICGFDLRAAPATEPIAYDVPTAALLLKVSRIVDTGGKPSPEWDLGRYSVMHQLCKLMTSRYQHVSLRQFVLEQIGTQDMPLAEGHISFEMRSIEERHHLAQLTAWLLMDPERRLTAAWRAQAVRYNMLVKDFHQPPIWYNRIVDDFSNWRNRFIYS
ncbi:TniQ family protein [Collimonas pratensis]|uniref:TniQ family protein n=1 Tax=Collimonas pratensis TaxID=279113 RepID=A0A127QBV9_9BURK|nr:tniQ family protein [Collimonas pratensis]